MMAPNSVSALGFMSQLGGASMDTQRRWAADQGEREIPRG